MANMFQCKIDQSVKAFGYICLQSFHNLCRMARLRPLTGAHKFAGDKDRHGALLWLLKVVLSQEAQMKRITTLIA